MKKNITVTVKNLHVTYKSLKKTSIRASWKQIGHKAELFHALKGVSFEIEEGNILGIIGKNGSGKSTMLRAIAGIFSPDKGTIDLHGNTISLLSIGVGFNKKLTGKENIYLSGMLLGFTEEEIKKKEKETDIMLIDEVLSVGDVKFKEKSYNKMKELISDEHRTVIIVSHSLGTIRELCNEVLWLNDGKIKQIGPPEEVIPAYEEFMRNN